MSVAGASAQTSHRDDPNRASINPAELRIVLVDHTLPLAADDEPPQTPRQAQDDGDSTRSSLEAPLARRWTKQSLRRSATQRKYARYQEENFVERNEVEAPGSPATVKGRRQRGKDRVRDFWQGKKIRQIQEDDTIIEILYENQRGLFTFGIPHFSSSSLLNFDPKAWTNAKQRASPVNITNAQVPDPNWEWAWSNWYVDMSRDVDEDGWEYSFAFYGCAWHGNHPWFHSFVRRRRWLRKRVRKQVHHARGQSVGQKHMSEAHMLTSEYFTIHPSRYRSLDGDRPGSIATSISGWRNSVADDDVASEIGDVRDINTLLRLMRKATIDREKIVLARNFLQNADDEIQYLVDEIPHIMSMMVFQSSRRTVLSLLVNELNKTTALHEGHKAQEQEEDERETRRIENLKRASAVADEQVKKLEFWSDIRHMVRSGKTVAGADDPSWGADKWTGVDSSGPLSNDKSEAKEPGESTEDAREKD